MSGPFYCNRKQREAEKTIKSKGEVTLLYEREGETASLCYKVPKLRLLVLVVLSSRKNEFSEADVKIMTVVT
jgi:hypothetical protein